MKALSIRQPWAWLIVNGYKTVENRSRNIGMPPADLLIHATRTDFSLEYQRCIHFLKAEPRLSYLLELLPRGTSNELKFGGIIGQVRTVMRVEHWPHVFDEDSSEYLWHTDAVAYVFANAKPLPFKPCKGRLGFFNVDYEALSS